MCDAEMCVTRHVSISQGQNNRETREKKILLQSTLRAINTRSVYASFC